ncbi:hypothetical protein [Actinomadura sp. 6N118]|uniref:hypothetical protein n=1 Tax=Actinomadura sp. 6N118 TaxID=3375151 RepID=UPI0037BDF0FA
MKTTQPKTTQQPPGQKRLAKSGAGLGVLAGAACVACCALPVLIGTGVLSGGAAALLADKLPLVAIALAVAAAAVLLLAARRTTRRTSCAGQCGSTKSSTKASSRAGSSRSGCGCASATTSVTGTAPASHL